MIMTLIIVSIGVQKSAQGEPDPACLKEGAPANLSILLTPVPRCVSTVSWLGRLAPGILPGRGLRAGSCTGTPATAGAGYRC